MVSCTAPAGQSERLPDDNGELARMSGPSTPAAYPVCGPSWASQAVPPAAASILDATSGLGPNLGISTMVA